MVAILWRGDSAGLLCGMTTRPALTTALAALLVLGGCKKFTAKGEASVEEEDGVEVIIVEVQTEPEAKVFLMDPPPSTADPKIDYKGETALDWVIADAKGKATLRLPMWNDTDGEKDLEIGVWRGKDLPFMKTPRFDFSVTVERKPAIQVKDGKVTCIATKCSGMIRKDLALVIEQVKDGTRGTIAGGAPATASGGKLVAAPDLATLFAGNDVETAFGSITGQLTLPVKIEIASGPTLTRDVFVPKSALRDVLVATFRHPEKGPIMVPGETAETKGTGALLRVAGDAGKLFGSAKVPADVDFVAVQVAEKRAIDCGRYRGTDGATAELTLDVTDAAVSVYERRTGKKRVTHAVKARAECPDTYIKTDQFSPRDRERQTFSQEDVDIWITQFVAAPDKWKGERPAASGGRGGGRVRLDQRLF